MKKNTLQYRHLIVNADDFGLSRGVNAAVAECARAGFLRSATIMANGPAFDDAVKTARELPGFGVGIHFVLTGLRPLSGPEHIPGLAGGDGSLPSGPGGLLQAFLAGKGVREQIGRELRAQAEKVFDSGIVPTHFDTHKHVHIIPAVLDALVGIARRYGVRWIRNPFESGAAWRFLFDVEKSKRIVFAKQYAASIVSGAGRPCFRHRLRRSGIASPDFFHGVCATGLMNERLLLRMADAVRPGINELMTHPGRLDEDLARQKTRLLGSRETERRLLCSEHARNHFEKKGIVCSHFGEVDW